jgi:TonB family protein
MNLNCPRAIAFAVLSAIVPIDSRAATGGADDPLKGIVGQESADGITVYMPWLVAWPVPEISLNAVLIATKEGIRKVGMDVMLNGSGDQTPGRLSLSIDGTALDLDLARWKPAKVDSSGCVPTSTVTVPNQEPLVRRISKAKEVRLSYSSPTGSLNGVLTADQREPFRRIIALYDMKVLPLPRDRRQAMQDAGVSAPPVPKGVTSPQIIRSSKVQPVYPEHARKSGKGGDVYLIARILKDGSVGEVRPVMITTGGCGFAEAAIESVRKWRYTPAMKEGRPIEIDFEVAVNFSVHN